MTTQRLSTRWVGFFAGLTVFALFAVAPPLSDMPRPAQLTASTALLMACWWITEAVPVAVTGLVPLVLLPLLGVMPAAAISAPYANKTNFLFLGGLIIATAVERWDLHRRISLNIIAAFGSSVAALVLGFMVATAAISMWISNSATTMMMLPIALAVVDHYKDHDPRLGRELGPALMLAVAYSATIGGLGTIVGTPPNAVFVGAFAQLFPRAPEIGFLQWMMVGVPLVVVLVPLAWFYLVRVATSIGAEKAVTDPELIRARIRELGSMRVPEKRVLLLFCATAALWLTRRELLIGGITVPGWASLLPVPSMVGDSTVAIAMAMILFLVPAGDGSGARLLDWEWAVKLPWGVIVLLGGGFALAEAIKSSGLAVWIGTTLAWVGSSPPLVSILVISLTISLLTEITTNTAITTIMMPILAASAVAAGCDPLLLMVPCALAASLCFMMPSGTAPNAIVFSGGDLSVAFMARTGVGLNLLAVLLVTAVTYLLAVPALGIRVVGLPAWAGGG